MHTAYITHPELPPARHGRAGIRKVPRACARSTTACTPPTCSTSSRHRDALPVTREQLLRVHDAAYVDAIEAASPREGLRALDPDTSMNPHTLEAALPRGRRRGDGGRTW